MSTQSTALAWLLSGWVGARWGTCFQKRGLLSVDLKMINQYLVQCAFQSRMPFEKHVPGHFIHTGISTFPVLSLNTKYRNSHALLQLQSCSVGVS